ncbi:hypothetical protein V6N12_043516 [Hibiscus sabdariffa]|uniref:DUF4283 domain-containing protein n=1 Tax=Hibiscus sabdariffa TaxID=183260 RepID=A0ABR2DEJ1_9ROSI
MVVEPPPSLDDVIVSSDDVKVDKSGSFPSVEFSEQVHEHIDHSMCRSLIIRLLGRSTGYKTLLGRIRVLWQPQGTFQLVDLANDYFLVMFENEYDYDHVLEGGPWTGSEASHPVNVRTSATESRTDSTRDENEDPGVILNSSGGSRFAILEENGEKELVSPVDGVDNSSVERSPAGVSESAVNRGGVNTARSLAGTVDVRKSSTGVTAPVQVVTSVAIAILDAANESRRQSLVNVGGRLGTSRKSAGDSLKAISRSRKGKENRPSLRPLLREWLPPDLPSATTSTGQSSGVSFAAGGEVDHVIPPVMVPSRGDTLGSTKLNASDH